MDWSANGVVDLYSSSANFFTCRVSQLQCHVQMPGHRSLQCACTSGSFDGAGICHVVDAVTSRRWRHADVNAIIYCNLRFIRPTAADWSVIDSDCCETHVAFAIPRGKEGTVFVQFADSEEFALFYWNFCISSRCIARFSVSSLATGECQIV